jgi:hypothetical protein
MLPSGREIGAEFGVSIAKVATGLHALGLAGARPGAGTAVTAPRAPGDRAQGGPILITLAACGPARPGTESRVLEAGKARSETRRVFVGARPAGGPAAKGHLYDHRPTGPGPHCGVGPVRRQLQSYSPARPV